MKNQNNQVQTISSRSPSHGVSINKNTASGIITLEIDTNKLDKSDPNVWKYERSAREGGAGFVAYFNNHTSAKPSSLSVNCDVAITFDGNGYKGPMLSDFGVVPEIHFEKKSAFVKEQLGYEDYSYGKEVDSYTFEIMDDNDKTKATKTFDPAIPEIKAPKPGYLDQNAVAAFLHSFIDSKFPTESVSEAVVKTFHIKQTIIDKDSTVNNTSVALKTVVVVQVPRLVAGCGTVNDLQPPVPAYISPKTTWVYDWYDVVPFPVQEAEPDLIPSKMCDTPPDYDEFEKRVYIDGAEIDADQFFNSQYTFGEDAQGVREVTVTYTAPDGTVSHKTQYVVIHESKPRVAIKLDGLFKQNRTMKAYDQSAESNDPWTEQHAPLEVTSFSYVDADDPKLKCRTGYCESNLAEKQYMYKEVGVYKISIAAKRVIRYPGGEITRYSDPYGVEYEILPDHEPAIIAHAYNSQISRLDELQLNYQVESTDGDFISEKNMEIFYDADNDGTFETKVYETSENVAALPKFGKLGQYKIVATAKEGTNQERLTEFATPEDDRTRTIEAYFFIDNYAPSSDLYLDVPVEKPDLDIYFLLDSALTQAKTDYVKNNKVAITNLFTTGNMLANVGIWDMKTYTYEQPGSTARNTGTSYPPSATTYTSPDGYSGTLTLTSVSNSPYSRDEGRYVSVTDSKTATDSCSNTVVTSYGPTGSISSQTSTSVCPSSKSYSDGKYSGTLSRSGESPGGSCPGTSTPNSSCSNTWTANYSGTVRWTHDVWEPKMVSYDSYTGYYSGTIYKDIRQPYDASFLRAVQGRYVVYVSDNVVSQLSDLQYVMSKQNAKLILLGQDGIRSQIGHDRYMTNDKPIEEMIGAVISYISESNPAIPKVLKLVGETVETRTASFDYESDPMPAESDDMQMTQDADYYDNSMGYDTFAGKLLSSVKSEANWTAYRSEATLNKPGKYMIFRKIKDRPTTDPNFPGYGYYSNESAVEVFVHRKPIADVTLDFDYVPASNTYRTTWVDLSYDLDHNVTRADSDRGIQDRTIKFTNQGTGEAFTRIPDTLPPGIYMLDYMAQDIEGAWSDPVQRTFVLPDTVPVQFKSKLKTEFDGFSLASVPASENLVAYDMWTRYPYAVSLAFSMGGHLSRTVPYYAGVKSGNDVSWSNEHFTIPSTTPDGLYTFSIAANGSVAGSKAVQSYAVRVATPIQLSGRIDSAGGSSSNVSTLVVNDAYSLKAATTKYPNATTVTAFKGTAYQRTITLASSTASTTGYGRKNWAGSLTVGGMPDGNYIFEWRSTTPNGNVETVTQTVAVINNRPPSADFTWLPDPVYEGDSVRFKSTVSDADRDVLRVAYEITSPSGAKSSFDYTMAYPYPDTGPSVKMTVPGNWVVKMTVSDGKAPAVIVNKTVQVRPLHVDGFVKHTELWDQHRRSYNVKQTGNTDSPRGYSVFWAGEKFLLEADTTLTGTLTKADRVDVRMGDYSVTLAKSDQAGTRWKGELWDETFSKLPEGALSFTFTAYYSNGTVKVVTVQVTIEGETLEIVGVHRVQ
ncbi:hypothetical protein [Paenibacillus arenilitoris]|uniref:PKD domain-containing protein n=1 Tax=Paenibacillus arenilitoris TaxID=2772299 RepID=A0A927CKL0_9BACL|nr:hypothetical protein [Paenibacillus arenilitoris]MBD2867906.1 hypothetical protein [Paenibacillus arenilitoris]